MFPLQICRYSMGNLRTKILKVVGKYNVFCNKGSGETRGLGMQLKKLPVSMGFAIFENLKRLGGGEW